MKAFVTALLVVGVMAVGCGGSSSDSGSGGVVHITMWHGFVDTEGAAMKSMVAQYNASHPNIQVKVQYAGNTDYALQKVQTTIASGDPPDIAYLYGSWAANIAQSPKVLDLNDDIKNDPSFGWDDFYDSERKAATVDGKIVGIPALVDNLALVYNKKLFDQAHIPYPTANWTWDDITAAAKKLTNPATKQFGWAYVNDGGEDTVWRYDALLWEAGGDILTPDNKHAAFNSPAGVKALTHLQTMGPEDHSVYYDNGSGNYAPLFNSGKIAMLYTGPWDLSQFPNVDFGVQILPKDLNHQTISGPDNWVLFNNGDERSQAAFEFMKWWTAPQQLLEWSTKTGDLPTKSTVQDLPGYKDYTAKYDGVAEFVANLQNAIKVRPVTPQYPKISAAMGQAIQAVLLGKKQPQEALDEAADQVNAILAQPAAP